MSIGNVSMHINVTGKENTVVQARGFATVRDIYSGTYETYYSDIASASYNGLKNREG